MQYLSGLLSQFAPIMLSALATYLVAVSVPFVLSHLKIKSAQAQALISNLLTDVINRGAQYAASDVQAYLPKVSAFAVTGNPTVDKIINYAAAQSPALLKKAGIDISSIDGQRALARRIIATLPTMPGPPSK